ncbi:hypothetical protein ACVOMV_16925 [Mesorhizobium atlanticum]
MRDQLGALMKYLSRHFNGRLRFAEKGFDVADIEACRYDHRAVCHRDAAEAVAFGHFDA